MEKDPYELNNLSHNTEYAEVKAEMLAELQHWRTDVISDQGIADEFRALEAYPKKNPETTADEWVFKNQENYDFQLTGWPSCYPTRTLKEWENVRKQWEPYVVRKATDTIRRPDIGRKAQQKNANQKK